LLRAAEVKSDLPWIADRPFTIGDLQIDQAFLGFRIVCHAIGLAIPSLQWLFRC
jgi:hypothetical protein